MALLKHQNASPPGGWRYRQSETGLVIIGDSLQDLTAKVVTHRQYKGLKPDGPHLVGLEIQRQICSRLGADNCKAEDGDSWVPISSAPRRLTLNDMLAFSRTALEFIKNGGSLAPKEEAKSRAAICLNCPLNQPASGCKCGTFYKMIAATIPSDRKFDGLNICQACACSLQAKVNVPMSVLQTDARPIAYPVYCWMNPVLPPQS